MIINAEIRKEVKNWEKKMSGEPSFTNRIAKQFQDKINSYIPEKAHKAITDAIKHMVKAVIFGAKITSPKPFKSDDLDLTETRVKDKINVYKKTAAAEGGITGAGGILAGLADFPLLIAIKVKLLFEIAGLYGFDVKDYKERLYILHIFQLAYCSHKQRNAIFNQMQHWDEKAASLPGDINLFDWRTFQQEYRDYIDLAKMAQLIPIIGAPVGLIANYRLIGKLGITAMNAYRMRLIENQDKIFTT
jgi:hypothetical protein